MLLTAIEKATNAAAVLMNPEVVRDVEVVLDGARRPTKVVAHLVSGQEAEEVAVLLGEDLGCGYGCSTVGVTADVERGAVTIDRSAVHDTEAYDILLQVLAT